MKTYKNIQEFVNSKPSKEMSELVLNFIHKIENKEEIKQLKIDWLYKRREFSKLTKIIDDLKKIEVAPSDDLLKKLEVVTKEKEQLEQIFKK
jgi:uncharacterized protein (DUF2225 family)